MGYKKKRSKDSLVASSIIAGLLLFSAYLMGKPNTTYGIRLALGGPWLVASAVELVCTKLSISMAAINFASGVLVSSA